jgi:hypothetical protein
VPDSLALQMNSGKINTVRLPIHMQKQVEAIASKYHLAINDVIRLALLQVLPVIEKEGITIKPGKAI